MEKKKRVVPDVETIVSAELGAPDNTKKNKEQYHDKITNIALFGIDYVKEDKGRKQLKRSIDLSSGLHHSLHSC